jgi:23S rRNA A2030 N6-methylase RlmJ
MTSKMERNRDDVSYLESLIEKEIFVVGLYEYLAKIYSKNKETQKAYLVCKKWFESKYWKSPNMATTSLRILDRMEKLEIKLNKKLY